MAGASTIVICREDLTIPGGEADVAAAGSSDGRGRRLFVLLREHRPDVVVLDLTSTEGRGVDSIRAIREHTTVPVLVVGSKDDPRLADYRVAGAADCLVAPVQLVELNDTIQRIIRLTRPLSERPTRRPTAVVLAGILFAPDQNTLTGPEGTVARLTTAENDLLCHLVARPWRVCSRTEIGAALYGERTPASDRAVDTIVNRLRRKFVSVAGATAEALVKTEFRRGYTLAADVAEPPPAAGEVSAPKAGRLPPRREPRLGRPGLHRLGEAGA